jgi:hypothetical protein
VSRADSATPLPERKKKKNDLLKEQKKAAAAKFKGARDSKHLKFSNFRTYPNGFYDHFNDYSAALQHIGRL